MSPCPSNANPDRAGRFASRRGPAASIRRPPGLPRAGLILTCLTLVLPPVGAAGPGHHANRLTYLDGDDPFHVGLHFPRLTTPQWVGEEGVDVVVTLGIDDMRDPAGYETFLRPILERLKQIDGRAPVSIFSNAIDPTQPKLAEFVREGLSLEVHTLSHPCPLLEKGNFQAASDTFHGGVALLSRVPGNTPVAFRTPCCDSINSPSPRVFAELFNGVNDQGQFLRLDSSVVVLLTTNDTTLPLRLTRDPDGRARFGKYVPFRSFVTTVEDYPYPWVIGRTCWEFPCLAPSDWEGQNVLGKNHPTMLADWKAALDAVALKQGTFNSVFHPHGWCTSAQWVEFIDHAVATLGSRVRFLTYREASERLTRHLGAGEALRAADGGDNGVRLLDLDGDGFLDVVIGNERVRRTRLWNPSTRSWRETSFPIPLVAVSSSGVRQATGLRFGIVHVDGAVSCLVRSESQEGAWTFRNGEWTEDPHLLAGLNLDGVAVRTTRDGKDLGVRFRDMDGDGQAELLLGNPSQRALFEWKPGAKRWVVSDAVWPPGVTVVDSAGRDAGLRFADLNEDGFDDLLFSDAQQYGVWLYQKEWYLGWARGWTRKAVAGTRAPEASQPGDQASWVQTRREELPPFVRPGPQPNNGAWIHSRHVWIQNENTAHLPDLVDRRSFDDLLRGVLPPALSPEESRKQIRVPPGFEVDLVASEPLVQDPVAIEWDEQGRLWVVEMRDYPLGLDGAGQPGGVVRILEDRDGDGGWDHATTFLEGVPFPSGVMPWRRGALVSAAPTIFYAEDTDGDGRADLRRPLITGFVEGNQQHRVNGFALGLDGWVYVANGDSGGEIRSELTGKTALLRGRDLRFRPDTGEFEAIEGQTQYGRFRDDWGSWFGNANYTWLWYYPWPAESLAKNPQLVLRDPRIQLSDGPGRNRVYPISRALPRPNQVGDENTVTSACGGCAYRDDVLGPGFENSVFIAEPTENLVHREVLRVEGTTLTATRAPGENSSEFLASTDPWFRPVQVRTGPDGALYVVDMYRLVIEHPEWIPADLMARLDLRAGTDRGRLFRVRPAGRTLSSIPRLARSAPSALVAALSSPNGWVRDTAMRLLLEDPGAAPVAALRSAWRNAATAKARLQCLATLAALEADISEEAAVALKDENPGVQAFAARWAGSRLANATPSARPARLAKAVVAAATTTSGVGAPALASALGAIPGPPAARALLTLLRRFPGDRVLETAVLAAAQPHAPAMLADATSTPDLSPRVLGALVSYAYTSEKAGARDAALSALKRWHKAGQERVVMVGVGALLESMRRKGPPDASVLDVLQPMLLGALAMAGNEANSAEVRTEALRVIEHAGSGMVDASARLAPLVHPRAPFTVQKAALQALGSAGLADSGEVVLSRWGELTPEIRSLATELFVGSAKASLRLVAALETGRISPSLVPPSARERLLTHADSQVRARAGAALGRATAARAEVLGQYASSVSGTGDAAVGRRLFLEHCASCHRFQGAGIEVGPDLGLTLAKTPDALLVAILDPNQAFEERYAAHTAVRRNGREFSGLIASESANSVTLRNVSGLEETLLRSELSELRPSGRSLMPEGFELSLDQAAVRDLISYLMAPAAAGPTP